MAKTKNALLKTATATSYFSDEHEKCCKYLQAYKQKRTNENLHQLRVSIKKIKAVFIMADKVLDQNQFEKHFGPYHIIFQKAGIIRDIALHQKHLSKFDSAKKLKVANRLQLVSLNGEFVLSEPLMLKHIQNNRKEIEKNLSTIQSASVYNYCKKLVNKLPHQWKKVKEPEQVHGFRKKLKQVLYCVELLNPEEKQNIISEKNLERIAQLQNMIGKWHDAMDLLQKIFVANTADDKETVTAPKTKASKLLSKIKKQGKHL